MNVKDRKPAMRISLLKASDVAERLNIGRSHAYQLMQRGEIPTVRFGRSVRVCESDLDAFIQSCRTGFGESTQL